MIGLIRSEWIKVTSTKYWWIMILIGMVLTALATLPILLLGSLAAEEEIPELDFANALVMGQLWSGMGSATVIALIIGILSFTGEYRHGTITDTFLTEPRRGRVIAAKAAVNAVLGVALAVMTAVTVVLLALWLLPDGHAPIDWGDVGSVLLATMLTYALYTILGVSVGALITQQVAAIVLGILWILLIEGLIAAIRPEVGRWLPGGAAQSILGAPSGGLNVDLLAPPLAVVVLLAYTVALAAVAGATTLRRDIT